LQGDPSLYTKGNLEAEAWSYNPHATCSPLNEYYIEQTTVYNSCCSSSTNYNKWSFRWCTCNLKHVYWH